MDAGKILHFNYVQFFMTYAKMELMGKVFVSNPHIHNRGELMLVRSGSSIISCEGIITHVTAPYIVYYPPNVPHTQENRASEVYERWCFPLLPADVGHSPELPDHHFVIRLTNDQCETFASYASLLNRFYAPQGNRWPSRVLPRSLRSDSRLRYLLLLFLNEMSPLIPSPPTSKGDFVNEICLYISEHPEANLSLPSLCERFYVGRANLTRTFRKRMNLSVGEFVTVTRVMCAKRLLPQGLPMQEIADRCGFSSVSYMSKVFTRQTGLTPARYRAGVLKLKEPLPGQP